MSLPKFPLPRETIEIEGQFIQVRGLTRAEAARFQRMVEAGVTWDKLEAAVVAAGTEISVEDAEEWTAATGSHVVVAVADAIKRLSRLDEGAEKSD